MGRHECGSPFQKALKPSMGASAPPSLAPQIFGRDSHTRASVIVQFAVASI